MIKQRAVVTGIGIIAPGGLTREAFFQSIKNGTTALQSNEILKKLGVKNDVAGGVEKAYRELESPEDDERLVDMAFVSLCEALEDSGLSKEDIALIGIRSGLSLSTSVAGHTRVLKFIENQIQDKVNSPDWLIDIPGFVSRIVGYTGVAGPVFTTMSACAAGTAGAGIALDAIRSGTADLMLVIGMDALIDSSVAGFHSLQSMSLNGCMPFDKNRDGMSLGEGAAAFIVESLDRAKSRNAHIYGELLGYGLGNDAYHITSPDPSGEGAYRTMKMALQDAGLEPEDIDYINAHGTATELNDVMETKAISKLFGRNKKQSGVMISSTKAVTGHCLGAAGSVELVAALLSVDRDFAPPTATLETLPDEFQELNILMGDCVEREIKYAMSNSFAFSGNSASIVVGKVKQ